MTWCEKRNKLQAAVQHWKLLVLRSKGIDVTFHKVEQRKKEAKTEVLSILSRSKLHKKYETAKKEWKD